MASWDGLEYGEYNPCTKLKSPPHRNIWTALGKKSSWCGPKFQCQKSMRNIRKWLFCLRGGGIMSFSDICPSACVNTSIQCFIICVFWSLKHSISRHVWNLIPIFTYIKMNCFFLDELMNWKMKTYHADLCPQACGRKSLFGLTVLCYVSQEIYGQIFCNLITLTQWAQSCVSYRRILQRVGYHSIARSHPLYRTCKPQAVQTRPTQWRVRRV